MLADSHLAYRGTLSDMCQFFGVATRNSRTNMKIKDAINALEENGLIKTIRDGNTWTLTLAKKAERNRSVIRIRRDWVIAVKTCKGNGLDWSAALKVWLFVLGNTQELITSSQIAEALHLSKSTVSKARQYLFYDLNAIDSTTVTVVDASGRYRCLGSHITGTVWIDQ